MRARHPQALDVLRGHARLHAPVLARIACLQGGARAYSHGAAERTLTHGLQSAEPQRNLHAGLDGSGKVHSLGKFIDDLRENRSGRLSLPHQASWRLDLWTEYATRYANQTSLDDRDQHILEAGCAIGVKCQEIWEDIKEQEKAASIPEMCSALISQINLMYFRRAAGLPSSVMTLGVFHGQEAQELSFKGVEQLVDVVSDYIFSHQKSGIKLSTVLDIEPVLGSYSTHSHAVGLAYTLRELASLKFIFDQCLFLDSTINVDGDVFVCRVPSGGLSEVYLRRAKAAHIVDGLILRRMYERRPRSLPREFVDYSVVDHIHRDGNELVVKFSYVPHKADKSSLIHLRGYISTEYLFEVLEMHEDGQQFHRTWDVLHSFSKAMFENAKKIQEQTEFTSTIAFRHLVSVVAKCLRLSERQARKTLEFFIFKSESCDGIWSRPIVNVDSTFVSIMHSSLLEINRFRILHHMVANAGLNNVRGGSFERKCVQQLGINFLHSGAELISISNPVYRLFGIKRFQTDFLVRLGNTVFVCEAKSTSHVATPREFHHGYRAISVGAEQLRKRMLKLSSMRPQVEKHLFGRVNPDSNFIPLVVTNTTFFEGSQPEGAYVVSLRALVSYFNGKERLSCSTASYYLEEGIYEFLSSPSGCSSLESSLNIREGFMASNIHGFVVRYSYVAFENEEAKIESF